MWFYLERGWGWLKKGPLRAGVTSAGNWGLEPRCMVQVCWSLIAPLGSMAVVVVGGWQMLVWRASGGWGRELTESDMAGVPAGDEDGARRTQKAVSHQGP